MESNFILTVTSERSCSHPGINLNKLMLQMTLVYDTVHTSENGEFNFNNLPKAFNIRLGFMVNNILFITKNKMMK